MINITFLKKKTEICELINRLEEDAGIEFKFEECIGKFYWYLYFGGIAVFYAYLDENYKKHFVFDENDVYNFEYIHLDEDSSSFEESVFDTFRNRILHIKNHLEAKKKTDEIENEKINNLYKEFHLYSELFTINSDSIEFKLSIDKGIELLTLMQKGGYKP